MAPSWAPDDGTGGNQPGKNGGSGGVSGGSGTRGGMPAAAASAGQTGGRRGGMAIDFRRGKTARQRLQVEWTYPVWKPAAAAASGGTAVAEREHALPAEQAYELVTGDDRRPLLVLRECDLCKGTDHAFLSRTLDNEPTVLLSHWFRCVKLPTHVTDPKHPLSALFQPVKEGEAIPHLFFCDPDGSNRTPLPGDQTQGQLWEDMYGFLERCYQGDAKRTVKELRALLNQFDRLDSQEVELRARIDKETEKSGAGSDKVAKFEIEVGKLQKEREALFDRERKLRALSLKELSPKDAAKDAAKDTAK